MICLAFITKFYIFAYIIFKISEMDSRNKKRKSAKYVYVVELLKSANGDILQRRHTGSVEKAFNASCQMLSCSPDELNISLTQFRKKIEESIHYPDSYSEDDLSDGDPCFGKAYVYKKNTTNLCYTKKHLLW